MRRRFQIVLSHSAPSDGPQAARPLTVWGRLKLLGGGLLLTAAVVGMLILVLAIGSIIAWVTGILLISAMAVAMIRMTLRGVRR